MFKYTQEFVLNKLFNENTIRIGTLKGYRDMEAKQGISDPFEGSYRDALSLAHFSGSDIHSNPELNKAVRGAINVPNSSEFNFYNTKITTKQVSCNFLIYCCSLKLDKALFEEFEDANVCYEIHKPERFIHLITWALKKELGCNVTFAGVHAVSYKDFERKRMSPSEKLIHPAIAKTPEFANQFETRFLWHAPEDKINKPCYDLNVTGIRKCCRQVNC